MKRTGVLFGAAILLVAGAAAAEDFSVGSVEVGSPWARATPKGASVAGAYMTITNNGPAADRLVGGSTPAAGRFEIHSMVIEDGVAKMRPVTGGLEIKAGATVALKPGSFHVMLIGLTQPLQEGARLKGTLVFEHAGKLDVEFAVQPIGQATPPAGAGHHH